MHKPLRFEDLAERHDIDPHQLQGYANAAKVRLEAHHTPPVDFEVTSKGETVVYEVKWTPCDDKLRRSYNNADHASSHTPLGAGTDTACGCFPTASQRI